MISKLLLEKNSQENFQIMFQICVLKQKSSMKGTNITLLKLFLNVMIRNIKIQNILILLKIWKYMELNKCTHKKNNGLKKKKSFLWFKKVHWVQKSHGVRFLVVPPKDGCGHNQRKTIIHNYFLENIVHLIATFIVVCLFLLGFLHISPSYYYCHLTLNEKIYLPTEHKQKRILLLSLVVLQWLECVLPI